MKKNMLGEMRKISFNKNSWPLFWEISSSDYRYKHNGGVYHLHRYQYLNIYEEHLFKMNLEENFWTS